MSVFDMVRELRKQHGLKPDGSKVDRTPFRFSDGSGSSIRGVIRGIPEDHSPTKLREAAVTYGIVEEAREYVGDSPEGDGQVRPASIMVGAAAGVYMDILTGVIVRPSQIPQIEGGTTVTPLPPGKVLELPPVPVVMVTPSLEDFGVSPTPTPKGKGK